jgi:hypothetical protein
MLICYRVGWPGWDDHTNQKYLDGYGNRTAKVWKDWQTAYTLTGHTQSVWAVLGIREYILTGEAVIVNEVKLSTYIDQKCTALWFG